MGLFDSMSKEHETRIKKLADDHTYSTPQNMRHQALVALVEVYWMREKDNEEKTRTKENPGG